jgi:hypothetical protein
VVVGISASTVQCRTCCGRFFSEATFSQVTGSEAAAGVTPDRRPVAGVCYVPV